MTPIRTKIITKGFLRRHRRKCVVCHHPEREEIEEEYINWQDVWQIARQYEITDYRSIHLHARAYGLVQARRENVCSALDNIVQKSATAKVTGDMVIRAIRAYSCLTEAGEWVEPSEGVVFGAASLELPAGSASRLLPAYEKAKDCNSLDVSAVPPAAKVQKATATPRTRNRRPRG
jgi:hypothetical protein